MKKFFHLFWANPATRYSSLVLIVCIYLWINPYNKIDIKNTTFTIGYETFYLTEILGSSTYFSLFILCICSFGFSSYNKYKTFVNAYNSGHSRDFLDDYKSEHVCYRTAAKIAKKDLGIDK